MNRNTYPAAEEMLRAVHVVYEKITGLLIARSQTVAAMESCTGGLIASLLTDTEGSSAVFVGGYVTYSNAQKIAEGVPAETIDTYGVYSEETALAMARACRRRCGTAIGIGVTGTAGNPDPANAGSRPGEVFFAIEAEETVCIRHLQIRDASDRLSFKLQVAAEIGASLLDVLSS